MSTPRHSNLIVSLSVFVVYIISFVADIFSSKEALVQLWPNVKPFLPLITIGLGLGIGLWFVVAFIEWVWRWISPRRKSERLKKLRKTILDSLQILENSFLNDREYWDAVRIIRDELIKLKIDCPEIRYPIHRPSWINFLGWHAALARSGNLKEAKTIMREKGFCHILSAEEFRKIELDRIKSEIENERSNK